MKSNLFNATVSVAALAGLGLLISCGSGKVEDVHDFDGLKLDARGDLVDLVKDCMSGIASDVECKVIMGEGIAAPDPNQSSSDGYASSADGASSGSVSVVSSSSAGGASSGNVPVVSSSSAGGASSSSVSVASSSSAGGASSSSVSVASSSSIAQPSSSASNVDGCAYQPSWCGGIAIGAVEVNITSKTVNQVPAACVFIKGLSSGGHLNVNTDDLAVNGVVVGKEVHYNNDALHNKPKVDGGYYIYIPPNYSYVQITNALSGAPECD